MTLKEFKPAFLSIEEQASIVIAIVTESSLTEEDNIEQFGTELYQTIEVSGDFWFVLDLHQVTFMSSSAIGKLIGLHRHLHRNHGRLMLCGLSGSICNVLQTAKLIDYFHVASSVNDAVESLNSVAAAGLVSPGNKPR